MMEHNVEDSPATASVDWDDPKYHTYTSFLRPSTNNHTNNTDPLMGRTSYRWSFSQEKPKDSALTVADIQGSRSAIAWFKPDVPGLYTLNLAVKGHGCTYTDAIKLKIVDNNSSGAQQLADNHKLDEEYFVSGCTFKPENSNWSASGPNTTALKRQMSSKKTSVSSSPRGKSRTTTSSSKDKVLRDVKRRLKSGTGLSTAVDKLSVKGGVKKGSKSLKGRAKSAHRKRSSDYNDDDEEGGEDDEDDDDMPIGAQGGYEDDDDEDLEGLESGDEDDENLGDAPGGGDDAGEEGGDDGGHEEGGDEDGGDNGDQDDDEDDDEDEIEIEEEEDDDEGDDEGAEPTQDAEDEGHEMKDDDHTGNLYDNHEGDEGGDADLGPMPNDPSLDDDGDEDMDDYEHPPDIIPEGDDDDDDEADPMPDEDDDGDDEDDDDAGQVEAQEDDEDDDEDEDVDE